MTVLAAWRDGARRVTRAPALLAGVWALTLLVSLPLTIALRGMLEQHLGHSLAAETAASGVNSDWMQEFSDQATGLGVTFKPTVIGAGAVLDNLSAFLDNTTRPVVIVGAASAYVVLWIFVAGGIIDRYARDRATRAPGFFAASGVYFFRFLQLAVVQGIVYAVVFGVVHGWLFDRLYPRLTHDVWVETTAFAYRAALYAVFGALVAACTVVFDYAKVRAVVEDRRSMPGAIAGALRFIQRNAGAALLLFVANFAAFLIVVGLYAAVAPGAGGAGVSMWIAFAAGQLYVIARLWVKLTCWASETALFQGRFAHAGYVARRDEVWPESPAAEAIL
ncbi:MAG: hypothetical protein HY048_15800 [Acidobacteria bacterium]|nr:hypothetical protein [Acidobacteriota bacterium]